jgi:hypothetical protein
LAVLRFSQGPVVDSGDGAFAGRVEGPVPPSIEEAEPVEAAAPGSFGTVGGLAIDPRLQAMVQAGR